MTHKMLSPFNVFFATVHNSNGHRAWAEWLKWFIFCKFASTGPRLRNPLNLLDPAWSSLEQFGAELWALTSQQKKVDTFRGTLKLVLDKHAARTAWRWGVGVNTSTKAGLSGTHTQTLFVLSVVWKHSLRWPNNGFAGNVTTRDVWHLEWKSREKSCQYNTF